MATCAAAVPSTAAARAATPAGSYTSPDTVPAHALAWGRRVVAGARFVSGADLIKQIIRAAGQVRERRLEPAEVERAVLLGRCLWHEAQPSPLGGRSFAL